MQQNWHETGKKDVAHICVQLMFLLNKKKQAERIQAFISLITVCSKCVLYGSIAKLCLSTVGIIQRYVVHF